MEFEEARKDLQLELDKGSSLAELRKKLMKGNIPTKVSKKRIQRKKRDIMELLNKNVADIVEDKVPQFSKAPTVLELWSKAISEQNGESILNKKLFKLEDKELLVRYFFFILISYLFCGTILKYLIRYYICDHYV